MLPMGFSCDLSEAFPDVFIIAAHQFGCSHELLERPDVELNLALGSLFEEHEPVGRGYEDVIDETFQFVTFIPLLDQQITGYRVKPLT
ncbi:hypothetical protein A8V01_09505 [Novosphingobium guangzhouense]|uniref:Uncharacterized protein n=1 Tax=Novosphingobium guangzhouense TaxID=1850347 RepID=A0A2K2FTM8_9SPHN|nr:hypothetical protein A8V01_09505 [Novosphingobium guangzhouense]